MIGLVVGVRDGPGAVALGTNADGRLGDVVFFADSLVLPDLHAVEDGPFYRHACRVIEPCGVVKTFSELASCARVFELVHKCAVNEALVISGALYRIMGTWIHVCTDFGCGVVRLAWVEIAMAFDIRTTTCDVVDTATYWRLSSLLLPACLWATHIHLSLSFHVACSHAFYTFVSMIF